MSDVFSIILMLLMLVSQSFVLIAILDMRKLVGLVHSMQTNQFVRGEIQRKYRV